MKRVLSKILFLGAVFTSFYTPAHAEEVVGRVVSVTGQVMARIERDEKEKYGKVEPRYLRPGDKVYAKDVINTSSNSTVKVMFNDQSIMDIGQSSLFKVEQFEKGDKVEDRKVEFSMSYGKVRAAINQKVSPVGKFKLKTKAATMGVRGTEFYVDAGSSSQMKVGKEAAKNVAPPEMKVMVTEGKVEVAKNISKGDAGYNGGKFTAPKPVMVNPGEKIAVVSVSAESAAAAAASGGGVKGGFTAASAGEMKVEKVSVQEMKSVTSELKVKDTTFAQAVTIESDSKPAGGNGQGGDNRNSGGPRGPASEGGAGSAAAAMSSGGGATLAIIKDVVAQKIEINIPKPGDLAIPGAMGTQPSFQSNFVPYVPKTVAHVTVHFIKKP